MKCRSCGAELIRSEHLPTEEHGEYHFACGSWRDDKCEFHQSWRCEQREQGKAGVIA